MAMYRVAMARLALAVDVAAAVCNSVAVPVLELVVSLLYQSVGWYSAKFFGSLPPIDARFMCWATTAGPMVSTKKSTNMTKYRIA